jgi:hypothetical protein
LTHLRRVYGRWAALVDAGFLRLGDALELALLAQVGFELGTMAIFDADYVAIPSAYLIRLRFSPLISARYIHLSLRSPDGQAALGLGTTRVAQPNINARSISAIPIRLPPDRTIPDRC